MLTTETGIIVCAKCGLQVRVARLEKHNERCENTNQQIKVEYKGGEQVTLTVKKHTPKNRKVLEKVKCPECPTMVPYYALQNHVLMAHFRKRKTTTWSAPKKDGIVVREKYEYERSEDLFARGRVVSGGLPSLGKRRR